MKIRIIKRNGCEKLILAIIFIIFGEGILSLFIPQIHPLYYLVDLINLFLLFMLLSKGKVQKLYNTELRGFVISFFIFSLLAFFGVLFNYSNLLLHLWGFRSIFSCFIFFVACVSFVKSADMKFLNSLYWLNLIVSIIEILMGYRQDWLGGIYGVTGGQVNGPLNLFLIIIMTKCIIEYFNKDIELSKILLIVFSFVLIATFAELKIFYIETIIIISLCSLVTEFSVRKIYLGILGFIGMFIGINALFYIFPDIDSRMFSPSYIWNYLTNDGGYVGQFAHNAGDINRLAFWDKCISLFGNSFETIFGLGIGNCDKIEALGIQSVFYRQYSSLHYYMFPLPMLLLQHGVVGMALYILFFVQILIAIIKQKKACRELPVSTYQVCIVLCLMTFIINIYDSSLLGKGGFLYFYILALPFINKKSEEKKTL